MAPEMLMKYLLEEQVVVTVGTIQQCRNKTAGCDYNARITCLLLAVPKQYLSDKSFCKDFACTVHLHTIKCLRHEPAIFITSI